MDDDVKTRSGLPSAGARPYRMGQRAAAVDATRRRITEAAVRLHTTIGPSRASMSAVADEAGVTRLTLYRHFATKDKLFEACMGHWRALHTPPDPSRWREVAEFEDRVRSAVADVYRWYAANAHDLYPIYRDAAHTPASNRAARRENIRRMTAALVDDEATATQRLRATTAHVLSFWTWRALEVEGGLSTHAAAATAAGFVLSSAGNVER